MKCLQSWVFWFCFVYCSFRFWALPQMCQQWKWRMHWLLLLFWISCSEVFCLLSVSSSSCLVCCALDISLCFRCGCSVFCPPHRTVHYSNIVIITTGVQKWNRTSAVACCICLPVCLFSWCVRESGGVSEIRRNTNKVGVRCQRKPVRGSWPHTHKHTKTSLLQIRNDLADLCADSLLKKTSKQAATHWSIFLRSWLGRK